MTMILYFRINRFRTRIAGAAQLLTSMTDRFAVLLMVPLQQSKYTGRHITVEPLQAIMPTNA